MEELATGPNHEIHLDSGVVSARVWRNAELSYEEGAQMAERVGSVLADAAKRPDVRGMLLDLREAPTVAGPKTRESIGAFFTEYVARDLRVAALVREDAVMKMQMERLIDAYCPRGGGVFTDAALARRWAAATDDGP